MIDKNLFLHDLAIVTIMKNEGPYLKEWLDYHLLAGVDHFYIYDNESPDNQAEVVKPYVEAGLVDYFHAPGKAMQMFTQLDAVKRFRFFSRYIAIIDGDEFIFPKTGGGIIDVVDEVLSHDRNAAGLVINWQIYGSNGHETADYSRGVLERFTRRAPSDDSCNNAVKTVSNPRKIDFFSNPHRPIYFEEVYSVNENGRFVNNVFNIPVSTEKVVLNHYNTKSREEYSVKQERGRADILENTYEDEKFKIRDRNEEFDDSILKYRDERAKTFQPPDKSHAAERLLNALTVNLSPTFLPNTPPNFYAGKMETFLTCRAVAAYLKTRLTDDVTAKFFEEASLKAILKSVNAMSFADARLLLSELPNLLQLPYPVVKELHGACLQIVSQMMHMMHLNNMWMNFVELDYTRRLLQLWRPQ